LGYLPAGFWTFPVISAGFLDPFHATFLPLFFGIFLEDTTFQTQVINFFMKTGAIFKGNFSLDKLYHAVVGSPNIGQSYGFS
jgi:hypothetical protein